MYHKTCKKLLREMIHGVLHFSHLAAGLFPFIFLLVGESIFDAEQEMCLPSSTLALGEEDLVDEEMEEEEAEEEDEEEEEYEEVEEGGDDEVGVDVDEDDDGGDDADDADGDDEMTRIHWNCGQVHFVNRASRVESGRGR